MPTYNFNLFYTLSGDVSQPIRLFDIHAGDQVSLEYVMLNAIDFNVLPLGFGEGMSVAAFTQWHTTPVLPDYLTSLSFGAFTGLNHLIVQAPQFHVYLENYQATRTYAANGTFTHSDNASSNYSGTWGANDDLYLSLYSPWGAAYNMTRDYVRVSITLTTDRPKPDVPTQFTEEQKNKFLADAKTVDKLTDGMTTLGSAIDPTSVPLAGLNWLVDQASQTFNPQMGAASATAKTMPEVLLTAGILSENLPEVSPIAFTVGLASIFTTRASDLLRALANDPPDLNYGQVLDFPQESFAPIAGIGASGNALLEALYKMVGDLTEMLAAVERFQGADFAGSEADKAAQAAAFDAALSAYSARRLTVASALEAFVTEAALPDVNFEDSTSISLAATFYQGLSSIMADPILNEFVTGLIDAFLPSTQPAQLIQAIQTALADPVIGPQLSSFAPFMLLGDFITDIENAIDNAQASPFIGSVLNALDGVIAQLERTAPTASDFNGDDTSDILWRNSPTGDVGAWQMHDGVATWTGISSTGTSWNVLGKADVNGDHNTDILVGTTSNGVTSFGYWEMHNSAATAYHDIGAAGAGWNIVGTGDFNGDGTDDILWRNSSTGDVGASEMHNGVASWVGISSTGTSWNVLGTADVNGDHNTDILVGTTNNGVTTFGYWEMHNSAATAYHDIGAAGAGWNIVGTGDFNGDGTDDILWRNSSTGDVGASEMHNGVASWVGIGSTGTSWDVLGTADVNGDDITDILVGTTDNGVTALGYWEMHNSANTGYHGIGQADASWLIT